jgi:hypothetical protein
MGGAISRCIGSYGWCFAAVVKWFEAGKLHLARTDFCWRDAVSVYVPHGNGKTTLAAPIALYLTFCDGEGGAEGIRRSRDSGPESHPVRCRL